MEFRSPLARARGLGSAHHGTIHWWRQRVTALLLLPSGLWLAVSLSLLPASTAEAARTWVADPVNAVVLTAYLAAACYHAALGLQVVMEDYIGTRWLRIAGILAVKGGLLLAALVSAFAILHIATGN
jgi:succinate dehydrogenase / fumarate reductase membrane anchor subunit